MTRGPGSRRSGSARLLSLALLAGTAVAPAAAQDRGLAAARVVDRGAVRTVATALNLQAGDAAILDRITDVEQRFVDRPGVAELTGTMMVQPRAGVADRVADRARARVAPLVRERFEDVGTLLVDLPAGVDENTFAEALLATGDYDWVEPDYRVFLLGQSNDPQFNSSWQHSRLQSADAWAVETGSAEVTVAVVDTGMDTNHPDLVNLLVPGFNALSNVAEIDGGDIEDQQGHGTFVAGCAAAEGNNLTGVVGVGWNFRIMPIKVSGTTGTAQLSDLQQGARWAADNGADVVNVSFSGIENRSWEITGKRVRDAGGLLFNSAGNDNRNISGEEYDHVVVVASTTSSDTKSGFSNFGRLVTLTAPGSSVRATRRGGGYGNSSGTSFSSPIAAGVGALIKSVNPDFTPGDVQDILYMSLDDLGAPGRDDLYGRGRVNSFKAVTNAQTFVPRLEVPVEDAFTSAGPSADIWTTLADAPVVDPGFGGLADNAALLVTPSTAIETRAARFFEPVFSDQPVVAEISVVARGAEAEESLEIQALDELGAWQPVLTIESNGRERDDFVTYAAALPDAANHSGTRLRIVGNGSDATDTWYVGDFAVREIDKDITRPIPALRTFEVALDRDPTVDEADGAAVVRDPSAPGGANVLALDAGGVVSFTPIDTADPDILFNPVDFRLDFRTEGVSAGSRLFVEYFTSSFEWFTVGTFTADGVDAGYTPAEDALDFVGFSTEARFRLRAEEGAGTWFVDEFFFGRDPYPAPQDVTDPPCNVADVADPRGVLDLQDIDGFISAFATGGPDADVAAPFGVLDLADIDGFINAFLAGCP